MDTTLPRFLFDPVEGTTIDGEEASTSELDIEVYNENAHEISLLWIGFKCNTEFRLGLHGPCSFRG